MQCIVLLNVAFSKVLPTMSYTLTSTVDNITYICSRVRKINVFCRYDSRRFVASAAGIHLYLQKTRFLQIYTYITKTFKKSSADMYLYCKRFKNGLEDIR